MTIGALAAGICATSAGIHGLSVVLAMRRCRRRRGRPDAAARSRSGGHDRSTPVRRRGLFARNVAVDLRARLSRTYEIVFCLASGDDPIAPLVRGAIAANPGRPARLLVGDDRISANPKLNNVVKGWKAARYDWVIIADSNVLMPGDYIQRLLARWSPDTGIVCAPPIGSRPETFAAEIECAFLNTYQARWQYAAESTGYGFAQGKTMLWRRDILEEAEASKRWARRSPKTPRRPSSSGRRGSTPISSTGRSSSRSAGGVCETSGRGSFAGRG